jgi:hypothetical protein
VSVIIGEKTNESLVFADELGDGISVDAKGDQFFSKKGLHQTPLLNEFGDWKKRK